MSKPTFEQIPEILSDVLTQLQKLKLQVSQLQPATPPTRHRLIDIDEVSRIIGKAKATIYAMVCHREIPCCKRGKRLYFYEDEIRQWIEQGRKLAGRSPLRRAENILGICCFIYELIFESSY